MTCDGSGEVHCRETGSEICQGVNIPEPQVKQERHTPLSFLRWNICRKSVGRYSGRHLWLCRRVEKQTRDTAILNLVC